jgi:hypothetical protein
MMIDDYDLSDWNNNHDLTLSTGESVNPPQFLFYNLINFDSHNLTSTIPLFILIYSMKNINHHQDIKKQLKQI